MYASGGFKISTMTITAYECSIKHLALQERKPLKETIKVCSVKDVDFMKILAYDNKIHPIARPEILKWLIGFSHVALAVVEGDELKGWGSLYKAHRGFRFMPLYANSLEFARILANELLKSVAEDTEAVIEVAFPDDNMDAKQLYNEFGVLKGKADYNRRMFTEFDVSIPSNLVYSILNYDNVLA